MKIWLNKLAFGNPDAYYILVVEQSYLADFPSNHNSFPIYVGKYKLGYKKVYKIIDRFRNVGKSWMRCLV